MSDIEMKIKENIGLTFYVIKKYFSYYQNDEDIQEIALIGLWKAVLNYNAERFSSFSSFAVKIIKNEINGELRKNRETTHNIKLISLDSISNESEIPALIQNHENPQLLQDLFLVEIDILNVVDKLSVQEKEIFYLLLKRYSQTEIAKIENTSQSNICEQVKKIKKKIIEEIS